VTVSWETPADRLARTQCTSIPGMQHASYKPLGTLAKAHRQTVNKTNRNDGHKRQPGDPRKKRLIVQADGTETTKDLSKGWRRCLKKITAAFHKVSDVVHNWFGIEYDGHWWDPPITMEGLEDAVREADAEVVESLLNKGLDANMCFLPEGFHVLDCLLSEQIQMLQDAQDQRQSGIGAAVLTQMFVDHEDAFFETMDILKDHGAKFSPNQKMRGWVP